MRNGQSSALRWRKAIKAAAAAKAACLRRRESPAPDNHVAPCSKAREGPRRALIEACKLIGQLAAARLAALIIGLKRVGMAGAQPTSISRRIAGSICGEKAGDNRQARRPTSSPSWQKACPRIAVRRAPCLRQLRCMCNLAAPNEASYMPIIYVGIMGGSQAPKEKYYVVKPAC